MSEASQLFDHLAGRAPLIGGHPKATSSVTGSNYNVSYFRDHSILISLAGHPYKVLDAARTYYRDTVEHAARCLGMFGEEGIARIVREKHEGKDSVWIDGVCWSNAGQIVDVA